MPSPSGPDGESGGHPAPLDVHPLDLTIGDDERELTRVRREATAADGAPPFSDQTIVDLRSGARTAIATRDGDGAVTGIAALTATGTPREAEFVVAPGARHRGIGSAILSQLLELGDGDLLVWAHGDHPDARALAARFGLDPIRELLQLHLTLDDGDLPYASSSTVDVRPFRPGVDDAAWLAVNAVAFADHPEQGAMTQADLDARMAEEWFDADDFLLSHDAGGALTGFCWLKIEGDVGEFYAVGVAPGAQGSGLGRMLVNAGLARFASRGIHDLALYVEGDNTAALRLYRSVGFTDFAVDIQYRSTRR
ncbi:mycothiol synthase [Marisediminicola senii]|uniref:mycothiol synthase n=1 Tax=Marisediminicola senii TaxID=2711233 RepID=UPI00191407E6|nr:mycothiol synthase [Marisediminicola senii]